MHHPTDITTPVEEHWLEREIAHWVPLFNETRQYNIQLFDKTIFLKYRTKQLKGTETYN